VVHLQEWTKTVEEGAAKDGGQIRVNKEHVGFEPSSIQREKENKRTNGMATALVFWKNAI